MATDNAPKVFLSYSHDSQEHKRWVLELATRLRNTGIDSIIDQWSLGPGDDIPHFMERSLAAADRVLMVCTDNYVQKANSGTGGVGYEKMIVTADLMKQINSNKIIPVIRQGGTHNVPTFLQSKYFVDLSRDDEMELEFDNLARAIHGKPLFEAPPISNNPFVPVAETPAEKTGDGVLKVMTLIVTQYESSTSNHIEYELLVKRIGMSRIMLDHFLTEATNQGLIAPEEIMGNLYYVLLPPGRDYAIHHKLIRIF
ncbi:toll/interleukin-1 receptor domain-containing protein [Variovorax dokdonensis]|uniref:Toll/interleukin-1 receptor domain-containing protein n=1 Tax=Variovorax dokdonensis TaxID=344883 RepID=A0ABT7N7S0_9BURK|nr:toll/interleukin-1 receptor domain-containing protein [Variovorax dokdonensis]MDM0043994.1 toll/interleukin-1 receptor domain-containing protein [Variovorax dokdonensis]